MTSLKFYKFREVIKYPLITGKIIALVTGVYILRIMLI